ncbi:hypothetical protein [Agromyces mangrovi Wang et al. 2018]|uniref:hypothetical protein n=1 Tax=Agromyces mangrovi TaxID=1858653 RepID=UPI0025743589|nr:hypothetical protein [Agromyces mangrovi]BDZ66354.1 hypothetical protein GCM10025877_32920 [Agromyces mangrovi]
MHSDDDALPDQSTAAASEAAPIESPATARAPFPAWSWFAIGAAAAVFGLLPWLVTGARLPLQNLWGSETMPEDMPRTLLPFSQYFLQSVAALLGIGAVASGIAFRALRARAGRHARLALVLGVVVVQGVALVQTTVVVANGLRGDADSALYLSVIGGAALVSFVAGLVVLPFVAWGPRAGALIGLTLAALMVSSWVGTALDPVALSVTNAYTWLSPILRWTPPVLVGLAIAWCGLATAGRIVAAVCSLLLLWVIPALATGVAYAFGSRVLLYDPSSIGGALVDVARMALLQPALVLPHLVVAIGVAALGLALRRARSR